eukprot:504751_1
MSDFVQHNNQSDTVVHSERMVFCSHNKSNIELFQTSMTVNDNTAINGVLFDGKGNGNIDIKDLQFTQHNYVDSLIAGENLMQFNNFIDFTINNCNVNLNDGDYLFNAILTGD